MHAWAISGQASARSDSIGAWRGVVPVAGDDHLLEAARDLQPPLPVELAEVPGADPAVSREHGRRLLGAVTVAAAAEPGAHQHLAGRASTWRDLQLVARLGAADRADVADAGVGHRGVADLAHPPELSELQPEAVHELVHRQRAGGQPRSAPR